MATRKRKKIVDKWKSKKWYEIVAPKMFDNKVIGDTVSADEDNLINRIVQTSLLELGVSGEGSRRLYASTKIDLRIVEIKGKTAYTKYIGHSISQSYLKTLARKGRSVIEVVSDQKTKDGENIRLKVVAITSSNTSHNTKKNIRKAMRDTLDEIVPKMNFEQAVMDSLHGKIASQVYNKLKEITKMMKVEIRKVERKENFR